MSTKPSVNLFCLIARESRVAVVFRRGPSKLVQLLRWDLSNDRFEKGQWFKGRIYERYCDLSPSGQYLVYWAGNQKPPYYHWTAVSRPPYLTALSLWPNNGSLGGGLFLKEEQLQLTYELTRRKGQGNALPTDFEVSQWKGNFDSEQGHILEARLLRDGWLQIQRGVSTSVKLSVAEMSREMELLRQIISDDFGAIAWNKVPGVLNVKESQKGTMRNTFDPIDIRHRMSGAHCLEMRTLGTGEVGGPTHVTEFRVLNADATISLDLGRTDWADWDENGDLLYAKSGCIFRIGSNLIGKSEPSKLIDLTNARFEPLETPEEFKHW